MTLNRAMWSFPGALAFAVISLLVLGWPVYGGDSGTFLPTVVNSLKAPGPAPQGMVWIPGGEFSMGAADPRGTAGGGHHSMTDARPIHRTYVDGFWMDASVVTNNQFAQFVKATGYVTVAERRPTPEEVPDAAKDDLVAGSLVFSPTLQNVALDDDAQWWRYVPGADWRHPEGPQSTINGRGNYPVVQVAYEDAQAFAKWAHKRLPTEAEWEFAARGGVAGKHFVWGDELTPGGRWQANVYQGDFPVRGGDRGDDGFVGLAPVGRFHPNLYGLYDMAGNVWQWCADWYRPDYYEKLAQSGALARNPQGPADSYDPDEPKVPKRVQRGGSFLCSEQFCARYILGSRGKGDPSSAANHIGFRCVMNPSASTVIGRLASAPRR
jgi:formylglycine-generating enzyme